MDSSGPKEESVTLGAYWCKLEHTIGPSMCGGDAAFLSTNFDQLLLLLPFVVNTTPTTTTTTATSSVHVIMTGAGLGET